MLYNALQETRELTGATHLYAAVEALFAQIREKRQGGKGALGSPCDRPKEAPGEGEKLPFTLAFPYLYLGTWSVPSGLTAQGSLVVLVAVGVNAEGYREVLTVEPVGGDHEGACRNLLQRLRRRGLRGVQLVISDDKHCKQVVMDAWPDVAWQSGVTRFIRNVLARVPAQGRVEVADNLKTIFQVKREGTAKRLIEEFMQRYEKAYPQAIEVLKQGIADALTYLQFPVRHQRFIRGTNMLQRCWREAKRWMRGMDRYLDEGKTPPLVSEALLHVTAGWTRRRYLSHPGQSIDPHLPNEQLNPPHEEDQVLRRSTDIFYKKGQEERLEHEYNPVVSVVEQEGRPVLFLQGTVDIFSAQELYQVALQLLERGEDTAVCWGQADHMDTTALQILLALRKGLAEKGKSLQMQDASSAVTTLLPMTGLTNAFGAAGDKQLTEASDL